MSVDQRDSKHRIARFLYLMFWTYSAAVGVLALAVAMKLLGHVPIANLTRDPLACAATMFREYLKQHPEGPPSTVFPDLPFYLGLVSQLGMVAWTTTIAVCFFTLGVLRKAPWPRGARPFCFWAGTFTLTLMLDDLFEVHELVAPLYLHIPEQAVYGAYGLILLTYLVRNRDFLLRSDWLLLATAVLFFGASLLVDQAPFTLSHPFITEDGFKFFGIVGWAGFHVHACAGLLAPANNAKEPPAETA